MSDQEVPNSSPPPPPPPSPDPSNKGPESEQGGGSTTPGPHDLSRFLTEWPFEAGKINVRLISGEDGEPRIQLRLDLGVLQMRVSGRPDGLRPHGHESMLEYQEARLDEIIATQGNASEFTLSEDEARELREEALQYYHRYVCLMVLEDFEGVVRDTTRNIRVLDLCAKYAETEADRSVLEQVRPYILMMRTRALASQAMADNEPKAALHAINDGLRALREYYSENDALGSFDQSTEVQVLKGMKDALTPKLPVSQKSELRQRLQAALTQENYELAAILRDELKSLKD
ncbi:MAG: UvrB/UvrC motif-containing protein [Phycisphaeraceae bacterium]|nr:UvrB/UvrC motif-containing protein [Phycisphaeraceae bacterium]